MDMRRSEKPAKMGSRILTASIPKLMSFCHIVDNPGMEQIKWFLVYTAKDDSHSVIEKKDVYNLLDVGVLNVGMAVRFLYNSQDYEGIVLDFGEDGKALSS